MFGILQNLRRGKNRSGYSLLEMVLAVAVSSILVVGIQSSVTIAVRSIPDRNGPSQASIESTRIIDQLASELETAIHIFERSATTLGFTVPDRNNDGVAERIRYSWSGVPGTLLSRQYNGGPPASLAASVNQFNLTPTYRSVTEQYSGLLVEDGSDSRLIDLDSNSGWGSESVTSSHAMAQYFQSNLAGSALAWRPTKMRVMCKPSFFFSTSHAELRLADSGLKPSMDVLSETNLYGYPGSSFAWSDATFSNACRLGRDSDVCAVIERIAGSGTTILQRNDGAGMQWSSDGSTWTYSSTQALDCELYGKLSIPGSNRIVTADYLTSMAASIRLNPSQPAIQTSIPALNHPERLSGIWELRFDSNPTLVEVNGDGVNDWQVVGGGSFNSNSMTNQVWQSSSVKLQTTNGSDYSAVSVIDLRCRPTTAGGEGALCSLNAIRSGTMCAPIQIAVRRRSDGTQMFTLSNKANDSSWTNLLQVTELSNQMTDVRLIVDPTAICVNVRVNGVDRGTYGLTRYSSSDTSRLLTIGPSGCTAEFSYARVRVLEP